VDGTSLLKKRKRKRIFPLFSRENGATLAFKRFVRSRANSRKHAFIKVIYDLSRNVTRLQL